MRRVASPGVSISVFAVSDAASRLAEQAARLALSHTPVARIRVRRVPNVRTIADVRCAIDAARMDGGIVVHTLMSEELRQAILREGKRLGVATVDLMSPLLACLSTLLGHSPGAPAGAPPDPSADRLQLAEAIHYALTHDDGQDPFGLDRADLVLVGVSRTCKTPLSLYLAGKGWRVANVPVILNLPLPGPLMRIGPDRVVGLIMEAERLAELRRARLGLPDAPTNGTYADLDQVRAELRYSRALFRKAGWPVVDMSGRSIEEGATAVLGLVGSRAADPALTATPPRVRRRTRGVKNSGPPRGRARG